jgi:GNAT superfamily N-acetyltransferase
LARTEDVPGLAEIELAAARLFEGYVPRSIPLDTTTDESTFDHAVRAGLLWTALHGDSVVGFAHVAMLAADMPHLEEIDVHPSHGRRGVGTKLIQTVCDWAATARYSMLTLTTFRAVPWNFPFYARLGFVEIPRENLLPELATVVANEASRGLDPDIRAVMGYRLRPTASDRC